tara:strand:- start:209 stop:403 length:195 start_codon:yes stop_codon:yes gene_type:complete
VNIFVLFAGEGIVLGVNFLVMTWSDAGSTKTKLLMYTIFLDYFPKKELICFCYQKFGKYRFIFV